MTCINTFLRYVVILYLDRLGAHYRTSGSVGTEQDIDVAKIIMHEKYNTPIRYSNDIALIKLMSPAELEVGVGLVCLPDTGHQLPFDNSNKTCWITGWGTLSAGGNQPNSLMQASVPLVSKQRCVNAFPGEIDDSMLCAGLDIGGVDTCQGDSGGPLVCEFNGTWYLEGVTSWGYGCAQPGKYGMYAKVRSVKSWLSSNMYTVVPPTLSPQNQSSSALGNLIFYKKNIILLITPQKIINNTVYCKLKKNNNVHKNSDKNLNINAIDNNTYNY